LKRGPKSFREKGKRSVWSILQETEEKNRGNHMEFKGSLARGRLLGRETQKGKINAYWRGAKKRADGNRKEG